MSTIISVTFFLSFGVFAIATGAQACEVAMSQGIFWLLLGVTNIAVGVKNLTRR